ncbi:MAG: radical SAM protein [Deltaproteobacteria bacterium]|nr:radical SAM protein [Deltaproteobacteria bacterium]MBN2673486.1 radical SAM protein [Deltaproteobacteria bacterium]
MTTITTTTAKSVLNKQTHIDAWFISRAHLNIYRGCTHNCAYCDGRYEGYYAPEHFASDITAKQNAPALLDAALNPYRKRRPLNSGYIMLGGGVSDSYQAVEQELGLARQCLNVILKWQQPVHLLTKSTLVLRDLDLLRKIHAARGAIVSFSFSTADDNLARVFEPGCSLPSERLNAISDIRSSGIPVGVFLMPVIPGVSDSDDAITDTLTRVKHAGATYVLFSGMTLKAGRQKDHFLRVLNHYDSSLPQNYDAVYPPNKWGAPHPAYARRIESRFNRAAHELKLYRRIPPDIYWNNCSETDALRTVLLQLAYMQRAYGAALPFGQLAKNLSSTPAQLSLTETTGGSDSFSSRKDALVRDILSTRGASFFAKYR